MLGPHNRQEENDATGAGKGEHALRPWSQAAMGWVWRALAARPLERALEGDPRLHVADRILAKLGVDTAVTPSDLARVPADGPLLVVANHPFGAVEGLALWSAVRRVRKDVRVLATTMLSGIDELADELILVDPFGGKDAPIRNIGPMTRCLRWLRTGGALIAFPAGEVASFQVSERRIAEKRWHPFIGSIAMRSGATVLPVFIPGRNSLPFYLAGLAHPRLRTLLLPREAMNKRGVTIELRIAPPVPPARIKSCTSPGGAVRMLRSRTLALALRTPRRHDQSYRRSRDIPVLPGSDQADLSREIRRLLSRRSLCQSGDAHCLLVQAGEIPHGLREIGRLRELTFRAVGEGTGQCYDLDEFDGHYLHLLVWNDREERICGAYRLARVPGAMSRAGMSRLYCNTLFRFRPELFRRMGPSLELGRSFVRAEMQDSPSTIRLLWKGLGKVVADHPEHKYLWGAVSISAAYHPAARALIVEHLKAHHFADHLAPFVRSRTPPSTGQDLCGFGEVSDLSADIEELSALVIGIEGGGAGIPPLLRQYVKLGGRFAAFNVDRNFGNCVDALVAVDLTRTDRRLLHAFLGSEGTRAFLRYHGVETCAAGTIKPDPESTPKRAA